MSHWIPVFIIFVISGSSVTHNWGREMGTWDRPNRQTAETLIGCISYKFQCTNAACVEMATNFLETLVCAPITYRCDLGNETKFNCKGTSNCGIDDKSICPAEIYSRTRICDEDKFQCKNKECVHIDELCNGKGDCSDGSHEATEICINHFCPSNAFRCAHGGCIPRKNRCNRVIDCIDGSDETETLCGKLPPIPTVVRQQSPTVRPPGSCTIPAFENGLVISPITNEIYGTDQFAIYGEHLVFECLNTTLVGAKETLCNNGSLLSEPPQCEKGCSMSLLDTLSVQATCTDMYLKPILCTEIVPTFTVAKLDCKTGYEKPQDRYFVDKITCYADGGWSDHIGRCDPVCGEIASGEPLIFGGRNTTILDVPWHVGVYELQNYKYGQMCGGTIITETVIISAAHCFWDEMKNNLKDLNSLEIVAGKTIRDYYAEEPGMQIFKITEIKTPAGYQGTGNYFMGDIAVVELRTPIIYQTFIRPICTSNPNIAARNVVNGTTGKVAGWGLTENMAYSPVLKEANLMALDYRTCIDNNHMSFLPFVTPDKYCAFVLNESVCVGDSGGGFAVAVTRAKGLVKYYLRGIVSVAPRTSIDQNGQQERCQARYTTFTNVLFYEYLLHEFTQVVNLMAIDYQTCIENNHHSFTPYVTPDKFCASVLNESVCQGDSGGGFAEAVTGADGVIKYYLRGLVSVAPRVSVGKNETQGESCHANKKHSAFTKELSYENLFYEFTQT